MSEGGDVSIHSKTTWASRRPVLSSAGREARVAGSYGAVAERDVGPVADGAHRAERGASVETLSERPAGALGCRDRNGRESASSAAGAPRMAIYAASTTSSWRTGPAIDQLTTRRDGRQRPPPVTPCPHRLGARSGTAPTAVPAVNAGRAHEPLHQLAAAADVRPPGAARRDTLGATRNCPGSSNRCRRCCR
jgi:hypothetical protein